VPVFTLGMWIVKEGRQDDFVRAWQDLAETTKADFPAAQLVSPADDRVAWDVHDPSIMSRTSGPSDAAAHSWSEHASTFG